MPKKLKKKLIKFINISYTSSPSQEEQLLHGAYVAWKQGATKGLAWKGLKEVFLEYERLRPDRKVSI